jgi:hypothetical protein
VFALLATAPFLAAGASWSKYFYCTYELVQRATAVALAVPAGRQPPATVAVVGSTFAKASPRNYLPMGDDELIHLQLQITTSNSM